MFHKFWRVAKVQRNFENTISVHFFNLSDSYQPLLLASIRRILCQYIHLQISPLEVELSTSPDITYLISIVRDMFSSRLSRRDVDVVHAYERHLTTDLVIAQLTCKPATFQKAKILWNRTRGN